MSSRVALRARNGIRLGLFQKVTAKRDQPRVPITGIDILLDHIKREVIRAAKTPNRQAQQEAYSKRWRFEKNERRGDSTDQK